MSKNIKEHRKMFKYKAQNGKNNICGEAIKRIRQAQSSKMSQRALADQLQLFGMDVDKNAIQRIECGKRFVTDIELIAICRVLKISITDILPLD